MFLCKIILLACACAVVAGLPQHSKNDADQSASRDGAGVCTIMNPEEAKKARDNWQVVGNVGKIVTVNKASDLQNAQRGDILINNVVEDNIQNINRKLQANGANPAKVGDYIMCKVVSDKMARNLAIQAHGRKNGSHDRKRIFGIGLIVAGIIGAIRG